jgi:hypothetical protein
MWEEEFKSGDCQFQAHSPGYTRELQHVSGTNYEKYFHFQVNRKVYCFFP